MLFSTTITKSLMKYTWKKGKLKRISTYMKKDVSPDYSLEEDTKHNEYLDDNDWYQDVAEDFHPVLSIHI